MQYNIDIWIDNERLHCRLIWLHYKWYTAVNKYNPIPPCIISTNIYHNSTLKFRILSLIDTVWGMFIWSVYVRQALELHAACIVEKIAQQSPKAHSVDHPVSVLQSFVQCRIHCFCFVLVFWSGWSYYNEIQQMKQQRQQPKAKSGARMHSNTTVSVCAMKTMGVHFWLVCVCLCVYEWLSGEVLLVCFSSYGFCCFFCHLSSGSIAINLFFSKSTQECNTIWPHENYTRHRKKKPMSEYFVNGLHLDQFVRSA